MTIETELRDTLRSRADAEPAVPGDLDQVRRHGRRKQRGHLAVGLAAIVAVVAVAVGAASTFGAPGPDLPMLGGGTDEAEEGYVDGFCDLLAEFDQAPPPEPGGNSADELTQLLEVTPETIRDDVRVLRDYHRDVYVEGDPDTDSYETLPAEVRASVDRVDAFAGVNCDGYESGVAEDAELVVPDDHPLDPALAPPRPGSD